MSKTTIPTGGITADAINSTLIADDAINSEHYTDGSIDTAHIGDSQVTAAKATGVAGLTLIKTLTITSTTASATFQNGSSDVVFDGTYDTYFITGNDIVADNDDDNMRVSFTDDTSSHSYDAGISRVTLGAYRSSSSVTSEDQANSGGATENIIAAAGANGSESSAFYGYIFNPAKSGREKHANFISFTKMHNNLARIQNHAIMISVGSNVPITGVRFNWNSGNFSLATIRLFGVNNG